MKRKQFVQSLLWVAGGLTLTGFRLARPFWLQRQTVNGRVLSKGKGVGGVVVSDGYNVVVTGSNGGYEFEPHPQATMVFVSTPSGYAFKNEDGIARHYHYITGSDQKSSFDFELQPLGKDDSEHQFIIWADPQVKNEKDVEKMMTYSVPDVQKFVRAAGADTLLHGITVGDIVWDNHSLFGDYNRAVAKMGIPFFQCLGNHDMDYNQGDDEVSDTSFKKNYGPTYYSFNRGKAHYIVMDNVRYLGKDRDYDGYITQNQLHWLQKDLSFVPSDRLIILCLHIPVHNGVKNNNDLYALLQDRNVHIMSGHTHYHRNVIRGNIYEHNHGTVCGAWWTGSICEDGTPNGYGIYKVNGTALSWHYQSVGEAAGHQLKVFVNDFDNGQKQVQVNIWNHDPAWQTEYWVDDVSKGALQQFEGYDPLAYATLLGPDLPKPRSFAEPKKTNHLFKALVPAGAKQVKVTATDRFGRTYSVTQKV